MSKPPALPLRLKLVLASQGMAPLAVKAAVVQQLGAANAALLAPHMPPGQLKDLVPELPSAFVAQVISHLQPTWILDTYLAMPDSLHLAVARELCLQKLYDTAAQFAECLPPARLRNLIFGLEPDHVLQIARFITNLPLIIESLRTFSAAFLSKLADAAVRDNNPEISQQVLAGLTVQRQAEVCAALKPATLKAVLPGLLAQSGEALRERLPERLQLQFAAEEA